MNMHDPRGLPRLALALLLAPLAAAQNHPQFAEMKLAETGVLTHTQVLDVDVDGTLDVAALRFSEPSGVLVARGLGDGSLAEPVVQPAHETLQALRFADLDGDGLPDALVANRGSDDVSVLLGSAGGLLGAAHFAVPDQPLDLQAGDLDGDGALDVAVACGDGQSLVVLRGDGNGGLLAPELHDTFAAPFRLALADFDEDGALDALLAETSSWVLSLFRGDGAGDFLPPLDLGHDVSPGWMQVADVREDGHADVVVVGGTAEGVQVLLGNGLGDLQLDAGYFVGSNIGSRAALADLDDDGHLDLVIGRNDPCEAHLLLGDGTGAFAPWQVLPVSNARWMAAGDMEADGGADLVASGQGQAQLSVVFADPAGTWRLPILEPMPTGFPNPAGRVASADFDGDGLPDLLITTNIVPAGLHLYRGLGDGSWHGAQVWSEPDAAGLPVGVATIDMNLDGLLDLVVASGGTGSVRVLLDDGSGAYAQHDVEYAMPAVVTVAVGHLDQDGLPDVAVAVSAQHMVQLFFGEGGGRIAPAVPLSLPAQGADVLITDVTGDDVPDVLAGTAIGTNRVVLWKGTGSGAFGTSQTWPAGGSVNALAVTDLQPDGAPDVLVALGDEMDSGKVALLTGNGAGSLNPAVLIDDGDGLSAVIPFDANGDGLVDLATASPIYSTVSLLEQDGRGGFLARRAFGARRAGRLIAADANGDGADDLLFSGQESLGALLNRDGPLVVLGDGLAGGAGVPALAAPSDYTPGAPLSLRVNQAAPSAATTLVVGLSLAAAPLKGGVLVPAVDALVALATDAEGELQVDTTWPAGLPPGLQLWLQAWISDAGALHGVAATRGLQVTTP